MASSPLILAALAKSIFPSGNFKQAKSIVTDGPVNFESAILTDGDGIQSIVRASRSAKGNLELATDTQAVRAVKSSGTLPFNLPNLVAEGTGPRGNTVQIIDFIYGTHLEFEDLNPDDVIISSLGRSLASIHSLDREAIARSGMPNRSASEIRELRISELDRAASTGRVPATLLQRWESALEDLDLFRFQPTVIHGNFIGANVLELGEEVSGVISWSNLCIGDPAEDFVAFAALQNPETLAAVKASYLENIADLDTNLVPRAVLYSELAVASYLVSSISNSNQDEADWAASELETISALVEDGSAMPLGPISFTGASALILSEDIELETGNHLVIPEEVNNDEIDVSDLKTRPIELPSKQDDQLF
jgi:aminoglycoside phosphotransferase (APT) family kinase protein